MGIQEDTGHMLFRATDATLDGLKIRERDQTHQDQPYAAVSFKPGCVIFSGIDANGNVFTQSWEGAAELNNLEEGVGITTYINGEEAHMWIHLDENGIGVGTYRKDCGTQVEWNNFGDLGARNELDPKANGHHTGNEYIGKSQLGPWLDRNTTMAELDGVTLEGVQIADANASEAALPQEVVTAALEAARGQEPQVG